MASGVHPLEIGIILDQEEVPGRPVAHWPEIRALAREAELVGVASLWVVDHFLWQRDPWRRHSPETSEARQSLGVWEAWTSLAAIAEATTRAQLGTLVTCTGHRDAVLIAKMAETVDDISNGRLILGVGSGDYPPEHEMFGYPLERPVARFEESVRVISSLLRTGHADFAGEFVHVRDAELRPRGPRRPVRRC